MRSQYGDSDVTTTGKMRPRPRAILPCPRIGSQSREGGVASILPVGHLFSVFAKTGFRPAGQLPACSMGESCCRKIHEHLCVLGCKGVAACVAQDAFPQWDIFAIPPPGRPALAHPAPQHVNPCICACTHGLDARIGVRGAVCAALRFVTSQQNARMRSASCRRTLIPRLQARRDRVARTRPTVVSLPAAVPCACHTRICYIRVRVPSGDPGGLGVGTAVRCVRRSHCAFTALREECTADPHSWRSM